MTYTKPAHTCGIGMAPNHYGHKAGDIYIEESNLLLSCRECDAHNSIYTMWSVESDCWIPITGRSFEAYHLNMKHSYGVDLDRFIEKNIAHRFIEIGAGVAEFMPMLAKKQSSHEGPKPVVIDPIDYEAIKSAARMLKVIEPSAMIDVGGDPITLDALIDRVSILSNPDMVKHYCSRIEDIPADTMSQLENSFCMAVDFCATRLYSDESSQFDHSRLLTKDGIAAVNHVCPVESDYRAFDLIREMKR